MGMIGMAIPKGVPDPTIVYQIVEEYNSWWGDDDSIWVMSVRDGLRRDFQTDMDATRYLEIGREQSTYDMFLIFRSWALGDIMAPVWRGEMTAAQSIEANKQVLYDTLMVALGLEQYME
jgi:hypothetical protein